MKDEKLTLNNLASLLAKKMQIDAESASMFLESLFEQVTEGLKNDKIVRINGLGTFKLQWNAPRKSVDVNTGAEITISGYNKTIFVPEVAIKAKINEPFAHLEPVEVDEEGELMPIVESANPLQKLDEQAEEIKDILSEIKSMNIAENEDDTQENEPINEPVKEQTDEPATAEEIEDVEDSEITDPTEMEEEFKTAELPEPTETFVEKDEPQAVLSSKQSELESESTQNSTEKITSKPKKHTKKWLVIGVGVCTFVIVFIALYFILQNRIEKWIENQLDITEEEVIMPVEKENTPAEADEQVVLSIFEQPREYNEFIGIEKLTNGSRLAHLSRKYYGAAEFWVYIYEANKTIIDNPNNILVGTRIKIPKLAAELIDTTNSDCLEYAKQLQDLYAK